MFFLAEEAVRVRFQNGDITGAQRRQVSSTKAKQKWTSEEWR